LPSCNNKPTPKPPDGPCRPKPTRAVPEAIRRSRLEDAKAELVALDKQISTKTQTEKQLRDNIAIYQRRIEATPTSESS
jgi:hypothetical protein